MKWVVMCYKKGGFLGFGSSEVFYNVFLAVDRLDHGETCTVKYCRGIRINLGVFLLT